MKFRLLIWIALPALLFAEKLTQEDRVKLIRGLSAEYASAKISLPRSKKPLELTTEQKAGDTQWDKARWDAAAREFGPAAKVGDQVQITKVDINDDNIILEINGGLKTGKAWRDRVQVGVGGGNGGMRPVGGPSRLSLGTALVLKFPKDIEPIEVAEIKKMLAPIFKFDEHSATEDYVENLPPEIQAAVKAGKVVEGMNKEQVKMVLGQPKYHSRESKDGVDTEDWVYGKAPGKITFVTFGGAGKVIKVKETYAGIGGDITPR
ncbi:MAG: hypothetical protein NTV70_26155 [Acidobacteria bacterium]|nr:hypothetical protein [Acidobacteriota bacterium]